MPLPWTGDIVDDPSVYSDPGTELVTLYVENSPNDNLQADEEGEHYRPARLFDSVDNWRTLPPGKGIGVEDERAAQIRDRLLGILFSQSFDIIDRAIGSSAALDLGCRIALGFKQGPLELMRDLGEDEVGRIMARFQAERAGMPGPAKPVASYQEFLRHLLVDDVHRVGVFVIGHTELASLPALPVDLLLLWSWAVTLVA